MFRFTGKLILMPLCVALLALGQANAATPSSGTLTDASGPITYTAGPFAVANPTPVPLVDSGPECSNPEQPCDDFALTVSLPSDFTSTHPNKVIKFTMDWQDAGTGASDYDLWIYKGDVSDTNGSESPTAKAASSGNPEITSMRTFNGTKTFTVKVVPYTPSAETVSVTIEIVDGPTDPTGGGGSAVPFGDATPIAPGTPRYQILAAPEGSGANGSSGEFNIGYNPMSGNIMTMNSAPVFRVTPPELRDPALPEAGPAQWTNVSPSIASVTSLDPIMVTDQDTGRTFISNQTTGAEALFAFTDDDGESWNQITVSPPNGAVDHQTVGVGPYPSILAGTNPVYPNAVYYCSQASAPDFCQRSDDGGLSFGPGEPINTSIIDNCGGLHGHARVAPDGTVYVPNKGCGAQQGGNRSTDAGVTWSEFLIPDSQAKDSDPSIALDADSTAYFCYVNGDGQPKVAISHDDGQTWSESVNIGTSVGVKNAVFPEAVAGDSGRAACGFLGSDVAGDYQSLDFPGKWYLFIATTYDGGQTWTTVNVTPNDPVQGAGGICTSGLGCGSNRNLLDFNEVTIDDRGRVLFGYDDGCVSDTCIQSGGEVNDFVAYQRVARQTGGKPLFAQFDPAEPAAPKTPYLDGVRTASQTTLKWNAPDNGGSEITAYRILRGTGSGSETEIATVGGDKSSYIDAGVDPAVPTYFYQVVAVNTEGDSPASNEVALDVTVLPPQASLCEVPGLTILTDSAGDSTTGTAGTDLKSFQLAQPYAEDGNIKLRFEINTDVGQTEQAPGSYWYVSFKTPDGTVRGVRMVYPQDSTSPAMPQFESYVASPNSSGTIDGRFVEDGSEKPADSSSFYDAANGKIVIVVPAADLGLAPGDAITGFNSAVVQSASSPAGGVGQTIDEMPNGLAYQGNATLKDNAACAPNHPPVAVLDASPTAGTAPLEVNFDASASADPDDGDSIANYRFDFGDGSEPVTQSSPTISHTYADTGRYPATLTVTDSHGAESENAAFQVINVSQCFEDDDQGIAYSNGWHTVSNGDASGGTFHLLSAKGGDHGLSFTFDTSSDQQRLTYGFATSTKGGTADVYIDGELVGTVDFSGDSGSMHDPVFGASAQFTVSGQGSHTLELANVQGAAYVDRFCISGASSDSSKQQESEINEFGEIVLDAAESESKAIRVNDGAQALSVLSEASGDVPFKMLVLDPDGNLLGSVSSTLDSIASLDIPVSGGGTYQLQFVNLGLKPVSIWSVTTQEVAQ